MRWREPQLAEFFGKNVGGAIVLYKAGLNIGVV